MPVSSATAPRARRPRPQGRLAVFVEVCLCVAMLMLGSALHLGSTAQASNAFGVVTVDLRPDVGGVPTHLCVVSAASGPRTRQNLADLVLQTKDFAEEPGPLGWRLDPSIWGDEPGPSATRDCGAKAACDAHVANFESLQAARALHVACTTDSLARVQGPQSARLLVIMLEQLAASPPQIESLRLAGGVATIGVQALYPETVVTARSLGGHYMVDERSFRGEANGESGKLVVLPLTPRCHWVEAELPGQRIRASDRERLSVLIDGRHLDRDRCVDGLHGGRNIRVLLPRSERAGSLAVELEAVEGQHPVATRYGANWQGAWPKVRLVMTPHRVGFSWRAPACIYPEDTCPRASLPGGIECSALRRGEMCQYMCPGDRERADFLEIEMPVEVSFEKSGPTQRWRELLVRPGQTLSSYLPRDEVLLTADISGFRRELPGNRVTHIDILGNDGSETRYNLQGIEDLYVQAQGAGCGRLRYRLVGDRKYHEGIAEVANGHLSLFEPARTAKVLSFNVLVAQGGGPSMLIEDRPSIKNPSNFTALIQLAANFRLGGPRASRLAIEMRLGGTLGQYGFYDESSIGRDPRHVTRKVGWARLLFEPALQINVWRSLSFTVGVGMGGAWPIQSHDHVLVGRYNFIVSPSADARFSVRKWLAFVVQARMIFGEQSQVVLEPGARSVGLANVGLLGLYGVVASF